MDTFTAFGGTRRIASGSLTEMLPAAKRWLEANAGARLLIFEDQTGKQIDFDFRGSPEEVVARATSPARVGPGRPKLGVVSREVSLLPRHWEWLEAQPSGSSAALRRLVDEARKRDPGEAAAQAAANRFMSALAGDLPGFEEAARALFGKNQDRFEALTAAWPADVRDHARWLAHPSFPKRGSG